MIEVMIAGRAYKLAVDPSQETKVKAVAAQIDGTLADFKRANPNIDRDQMLVLACFQWASQAAESSDRLDEQGLSVMKFHRELANRLERMLPV
jgi:cell division protein ZapA (FtsZ GTPase activity inhibitor)